MSHCYKLIKNISRIRKVITKEQTEILVHSVISSKLDYCNSLLINTSQANLFKLQKVQNTAARLVVQGRKRDGISKVLRDLHWLKIESKNYLQDSVTNIQTNKMTLLSELED